MDLVSSGHAGFLLVPAWSGYALLPHDDSGDPNVSRPDLTTEVELDPNPEAAAAAAAVDPGSTGGWLEYVEASVP